MYVKFDQYQKFTDRKLKQAIYLVKQKSLPGKNTTQAISPAA